MKVKKDGRYSSQQICLIGFIQSVFDHDTLLLKMIRLISQLLVLAIIAMVASCAPNNLSIRLAYSRLDNVLYERLSSYANFNDDQLAWIEAESKAYQLWHRQTELPDYADYFSEIASLVESGELLTTKDVETLLVKLEYFSSRGYRHSPFANSTEFLQQVSDMQVLEMYRYFDKRNAQWLQHVQEQSNVLGNDERIDRLQAIFDRVGLSLNPQQRRILDKGFDRYAGQREDRIIAWTIWQKQFLIILEGRSSETFITRMQAHLDVYREQMKIQHPERSKKNKQIAIETVTDLLNSFTEIQRRQIVTTLRDSRDVLVSMAASKQTTLL